MGIFNRLDALSTEPITPRVYREIRDAIIGLRLKPGWTISEADVARQFGASRQPVHDAFLRLQSSGLLLVLPQRGTRVARISIKAVRDARIIRLAIETATVGRACEARAPDVIVALHTNVEAQEEARAAGDTAEFHKIDDEYHRLLAECGDLESAWSIIEDVKSNMDRVRFLSLPRETPLDILIGQHREIVRAVERGDAATAKRAITAHLSEIDKSLPVLEAEYPDLFDRDDRGL